MPVSQQRVAVDFNGRLLRNLYAMALTLTLIVMGLFLAKVSAPFSDPACQLVAGADDVAFSLAGSGARVAQLLMPDDLPNCRDERIARYVYSTGVLDSALFIPLYTILAALLAWHAGRLLRPTAGLRRSALPTVLLLIASLVLLTLDYRENHTVMDLLAMAGQPWLDANSLPNALDEAARQTRDASLLKWWASGLWALCLAYSMRRAASCLAPSWARLLARACWLILNIAGFLLLVGAALGSSEWIRLGFGVAALGLPISGAHLLVLYPPHFLLRRMKATG